MNNTAKQTGQSAVDLAQKIARQVAEEPIEILKDAREQVTGQETSKPLENQTPKNQVEPSLQETEQQKVKDKAFSERRMQALQNEIEDIRKGDLFKDLQAKISEGIEIPLEDYPELSMEQKQVLKAQMEAVKFQKQQAEFQSSVQEVPSVSSKPSRRFGAGQKHEAEKQQTRVEKPVPPSG